LPPPSK
jgi:Tol biopolymer transport system component